MLNTLRIKSLRATGLSSALATLLLAASPWAAAAPVTVDLCATSGTSAGSVAIAPAVPVYGYASGACTATALTGPGGPVISVMEGDVVTVNLQNALSVPSGLVFIGQTMVPDTTGAPAAAAGVPGSKSYSFTASKAGTYLYQAAPIVGAEYQVAMGLYGALVVRPNVTFTATGVTIARSDAAAAVTNASLEVADTAVLATDVGSSVSGTGVPAATTISAVVPGVSFTMSNAATADGTGVVITRTDAAATVTSASTTVLDATVLDTDVGSAVAGGGIPAGATIASVTAATSFVMSQAAQPAAYDANTVVDDEAVLVLSEIDPALNGAASPADFDMRNLAPKYFLINGKVYPDTAEIVSAANHKVLLRYVNAGAKHHSMGVLGLRQSFLAKDARLLPTAAVSVTAETLAPGQTGDALVTVPATAGKFALYDANLALHNNADAGIGGMLTFVNAGPGAAAAGATVANVVFTPPAVASGTSNLTADASVATGTVAAAEYFVDAKGADGGGLPLTGTFGGLTAAISATIDGSALSNGKHTFYVHAQDGNGLWGSYNFAVLNVDKTGPTSSALVLTPNPSNGTGNVTLTASASDVDSGGSLVTAARYSIDGGPTAAMNPAGADATVRSLSVSFAAPAAGTHTIAVESQDALGNWGPVASTNLVVTGTGPTTSNISISPNPTNGIQGANSSSSVVRVTATMSSPSAKIAAAEAFIDTVGANGSGFPFVPSDGQFAAPTDTGTESGYGDIPLTTVAGLAAGNHTIYVHGRDTAGNWGNTASGVLVVNKSAPTVSNVLLVPPYANNTQVQITATASDAATGNNGIAGGEFFIDTVGAIGTGTAMSYSNGALRATITSVRVSNLTPGVHTVYVRARDGVLPAANANWSATMGAALTIDRTRPTFVSITRNGTSPTNAGSVSYTVRFSEPVIGVGQGDFQVIRNPAGGNTNVQVTGSGATRVVTLSGYGNNFVGTIGVNVRNNATITDLAGNAWLAATQVGQAYVVDRVGPSFASISITPSTVPSGTPVSLTVTGASDGTGGVGVAGGEWWIRAGAGNGGQNIPAGTGTAFAAGAGTTSGIAVATTGLAPGNYTVRVRMRDALGNWSGGNNGVRITALRVN